jgi:hypothetical protein
MRQAGRAPILLRVPSERTPRHAVPPTRGGRRPRRVACRRPAADAAKRKPKSPKKATYTLAVKGTQVTTWDYHKRQAPSCDWPEEGHGSQEINFKDDERKEIKVTVTTGPGGGVSFSPSTITLDSWADINNSWKRLFTQQSACLGGGAYGGDGPPQDAIGSENCLTSGNIDMRIGASRDEVWPAGDPNRPESKLPKNALLFRGEPAWLPNDIDSYRSLPALCSQHGKNNSQLGLGVTRGEYLGGLIESVEKLPAKKLLDPKTKKLKFSGSAKLAYPNEIQTEQPADTTTGNTVLAYNLTFKRVGR